MGKALVIVPAHIKNGLRNISTPSGQNISVHWCSEGQLDTGEEKTAHVLHTQVVEIHLHHSCTKNKQTKQKAHISNKPVFATKYAPNMFQPLPVPAV